MITSLRWWNTLNHKIPKVCVQRERKRDTFFLKKKDFITAAEEKLSTNPAQVTATYTESLKYQDDLNDPDRVLWKVAPDLEYSTLENMGYW